MVARMATASPQDLPSRITWVGWVAEEEEVPTEMADGNGTEEDKEAGDGTQNNGQ